MKLKKICTLLVLLTISSYNVYGSASKATDVLINTKIVEKGEPTLMLIETDEELNSGEYLSLSLKNLVSNQILNNHVTLERNGKYNYGAISTDNLDEGRYSVTKIDIVDKNDNIIRGLDTSDVRLDLNQFDVTDDEYEINNVVSYNIVDTRVNVGEHIDIEANLEEYDNETNYTVFITFEHIVDESTFEVELDKKKIGNQLSTTKDYVIPNVKEGTYNFKKLSLYKTYEYKGLKYNALIKSYDDKDFSVTQITVNKEAEEVGIDKIHINNSPVHSYDSIYKELGTMNLKPNFINGEATVIVPYSFLEKLYEVDKSFTFEVEAKDFTYILPVDIKDRTTRVESLINSATKNGTNLKNIAVKVIIKEYSEDEKYKEAFNKAFDSSALLSGIYNVDIELLDGSKVLGRISNFTKPTEKTIKFNNRTGVPGVFVLESDINPKFVPHVINGDLAKITSINNGTFAVLLNRTSYIDVPATAWYSDSVTISTGKALTKGVGGSKFMPTGLVSRAEFVTMIVNGLDLKPENIRDQEQYSDVQSSNWYYETVMTAKEFGLLDEIATTSEFNPSAFITREEMANIIGKVIEKQNLPMNMMYIDLDSIFEDSNLIDRNYVNEIQDVYKVGIMKGNEKSEFNPKGNSTRAEAVQVQINLLKLLGNL